MKYYTIREAAQALGVTKPTAARYARMLPAEETAQGEYRGQPQTLITEAGLTRMRSMFKELQAQSEAQNEAQKQAETSANSATFDAPSETKRKEDAERLISALEDRIKAQESTISTLTEALKAAQEATRAAQALHAATAEQLRLLTAAQEEEPEPGQEQPEESRTEDAAAETENQEPAAAPTLGQRLRFLFTGKFN